MVYIIPTEVKEKSVSLSFVRGCSTHFFPPFWEILMNSPRKRKQLAHGYEFDIGSRRRIGSINITESRLLRGTVKIQRKIKHAPPQEAAVHASVG